MDELVCWSCGASLSAIPLPFTRLEQCKHCHVDLHVCRLCRFYNPRVSDKCDHEQAEPARDISVANFCDYFQPRADAFVANADSNSEAALDKLRALFGEPADSSQTASSPSHSKNKFDALFKDKND